MNGEKKPVKWDLIWLTGFMGVGKSRISKSLAAHLGWERIDTDQEIQNHLGLSVNEVFSRLGEKKFRAEEKKEIAHLSTRRQLIVSLGGGSLMDESTQELVVQSGVLVYLMASTESLMERLKSNWDKRPALKEATLTKESILSLFELRRSGYERSHWMISTDEMDPEEIGTLIGERFLKERS